MIQRIAKGLKMDSPELFSMQGFPSARLKEYQKEVLEDIAGWLYLLFLVIFCAFFAVSPQKTGLSGAPLSLRPRLRRV
jgi:hypothetical protein